MRGGFILKGLGGVSVTHLEGKVGLLLASPSLDIHPFFLLPIPSMNAPYIHLIFSHIAVVGIPLALLIFIIAYLKKSQEVFMAGCWLLLLVSLAAIPTYWAGAPTEEIVEHYPHFSRPIQEIHEQWAQYALLSTLISGFLALVCLFYDSFRKKLNKLLVTVTVLWLALNIIILLVTANYGGKIIHREIRGQMKTQPETEHESEND